ncbi:hypothetical protein [Campylobacter sputorum]|uniref:hypothetical protein n=1 Tax=Campylobacter sputorum TaxID=206 RepID=UPI000B789643|nr:hypothetical protein [Campylobacter sputorum]ASM36395.1 hypothetical protein CSF_0489 [Campylobacter sputorum bv. faecalis CCUG 20703]
MKIINFILALCITLFAHNFELDFNKGAIENVKQLSAIDKFELNLTTKSSVLGLDYQNGEFLIATKDLELLTLDENLKEEKSYLKSTKDWIIQFEDGVSAAYFKDSIGIMSYNKTYAFFKHDTNKSKEEINLAWRYLLKGYENFTLDFKDRYYTIRAKQQYILSWDYSDFYKEFFIATVPDDIKEYWSIASFSEEDNMLSSEFIPTFGENLKIKDQRNLNDYYITGIDANGEFVYLLSIQYSSILKLDPRTRTIVDVYVFKDVKDATALAIKDGIFYIASRESGKNFIYTFKAE